MRYCPRNRSLCFSSLSLNSFIKWSTRSKKSAFRRCCLGVLAEKLTRCCWYAIRRGVLRSMFHSTAIFFTILNSSSHTISSSCSSCSTLITIWLFETNWLTSRCAPVLISSTVNITLSKTLKKARIFESTHRYLSWNFIKKWWCESRHFKKYNWILG